MLPTYILPYTLNFFFLAWFIVPSFVPNIKDGKKKKSVNSAQLQFLCVFNLFAWVCIPLTCRCRGLIHKPPSFPAHRPCTVHTALQRTGQSYPNTNSTPLSPSCSFTQALKMPLSPGQLQSVTPVTSGPASPRQTWIIAQVQMLVTLLSTALIALEDRQGP